MKKCFDNKGMKVRRHDVKGVNATEGKGVNAVEGKMSRGQEGKPFNVIARNAVTKQSTATVETEQMPCCHPELVSGSVNLIETKQTDRFRIKSGMTERGFLEQLCSKMLNQVQHDNNGLPRPHCVRPRNDVKKIAFTLAEVLITLTIVGVVAAMTIPSLMSNISERVKNHQIEVFKAKLHKGCSLLNVENGIGPYYNSTMEFVTALSKHMKIVTICDENNLSNPPAVSNHCYTTQCQKRNLFERSELFRLEWSVTDD